MAEIKVGDLVQWEAGERSRAGVVKSVNPDGSCTVSRQTPAGEVEEKIKTGRLETITSTIEPGAQD
jgi:surface antigen